jgi:uncharacterized Zn-binding protein involved in type VI secretion
MAGVAINGSQIVESIKPNHVTYSIETWQIVGSHCVGWDENGICNSWAYDYDWVPSGSGSTGAKITGYVSVPSSKLKVGGSNVAKVGDITVETWVADPPIPASTSTTRYTPTSPTSGSGQGRITSGSSKARLEGQPIALIGSQVTTCLGTTTTIANGNTKLNIPN